MSRKSTIDALFGTSGTHAAVSLNQGNALGAPNNPQPNSLELTPTRTGAVAAMGATLQRWSDAARHVEEVQSQLAGANSVVDIDPELIDPAPVRDRIDIGADKDHLALKVSIRDNGQQVPILVRPHPINYGRYQCAYGHRRIAACRELGIKVRAVIAVLTDDQLVRAQGQENSERRDLSFIEIALFALKLESAGFSRALIIESLGIDKADVSRVIHVAKSIPELIIQAIGPAPKAGRTRWLNLSEALRDDSARERIIALSKTTTFREHETDARFALALRSTKQDSIKTQSADQGRQCVVRDGNGRELLWVTAGGKTIDFRVDAKIGREFSTFMAEMLPGLYERFLNTKDEPAA